MQNRNVILFVLTLFFIGLTGLYAQTVKDIEGNVYHTVTIGIQVWTTENLKTTKYNDGTSISLVTDNSSWEGLNTPAFCWYDNDAKTNKDQYGALYNWFAVKTNKLCPIGWHIPIDMEWQNLAPLPAGYRYSDGSFHDIKNASYWWTATESSIKSSYYRGVWWDGSNIERDVVDKRVGYAIRCIKN